MDRLPAPLDVRPFLHPDSSTLDPPAPRRDSSNSPSPSPVIPDRRRSRENQKILRPRKRSSHPTPPTSSDADPAVISRIVDSFGDLPDDPILNEPSLTHSRRSSRHSGGGVTDAPIRRSLSTSRRSAVMMDAGIRMLSPYTHQEDADAEADYDAALPPSVPTSRHYPSDYTNASPRTLSARRMAKRQNFATSPDPYGSDANPRNKLSAESWVRQGAPQEQDIPEPKSIVGVRKLRRVNSKDSLRLSEKRSNQSLKHSTGPQDSARLSEKHSNKSLRYRTAPEPLFLTDEPRAEQIFTKESSPKPTPKGRLYLSDSGGSDGQGSPEMLRSPAQGLGLTLQPDYVASYDSSRDLTPEEAVKRLSTELNKRMSIVDSVPTRTSSLQRRVKKAKRDSLARAPPDDSTTPSRLQEQEIHVPEPVQPEDTEMLNVEQVSPILDASWTDLGEDDHTVRRIRQLREQRKNRIAEGQTSPGPTEDAFADFDGLDSPRKDEPVSTLDKIKQQHASEHTPEPSPVKDYSMPTPPMNQDGAFGRTMSGLSARDAESTRNQLPTPARSLSPSDSAMRQSLDAQAMSDTGTSPTPFLRRATTKKRSKSQRRGGTRLPDLPDDMEEPRSNRRRSMSAAGDPMTARRDSIEFSVRDYLRARRLNRKVRHPQTGRIICFSEVGDPHGHAVFVCVGMGLTRFVTAFFDELATTLGLRLVTLDRPGVGGSQAYPPGDKSGPLNWPDDVLAVCYELGIDRFSMLAHSAGAVYALATALILPNMVRGKIHLLAPWIPPSQLTVTHHPSSASQQQPGAGPLPRSQRILRVLPASVFKAANSTFISTTSASIKPATKKQIDAVRAQQQRELYSNQPPPTVEIPQTAEAVQPPTHIRRESMMAMDQHMPETTPQQSFGSPADITEEMQENMILASTTPATDPELSFAANSLSAAEYTEKARKIEYTSRLTHRTWELATRDSNPATDLLVCLERHREIGFRYTDIDQPVVITHGSEDKRVPVGNVKWLAQQMNIRAEAVRLSLVPDSPTRPDSRDTWYERGRGGGGCEIRVLEGEEHGLMASASIMSDVLEEISEYWRAAGQNH